MSNILFLFSDESGIYNKNKTSSTLRAHPYYVRSNLMISLDDYNDLEKKMNEYKKRIGLSPFTEIKWSHMGTLIKGRGVGYDISLDQIKECFRDISIMIKKCETIKLFFTITKQSETGNVDKVKLIKMHLQNAYQRIEKEIGVNDKKAIVIADDLNSENKALKKALFELSVQGDAFSEFSHIYKGLFVDYSDQCCGLQLADICASIITASLKYEDADILSKHKFSFTYRLLTEYIFERIRGYSRDLPHYRGYRYGIKEVPNDCGKNEVMRLSKVIAHRKKLLMEMIHS